MNEKYEQLPDLEAESGQELDEKGPLADENNGFIEGELLESKPQSLPTLSPKSGYKTSQGQLTVLFMVASMVLGYFGWNKSAQDIQNGYDLVVHLVETVGPLLSAALVLWNYINSRGKIQSNSLWASAAISVANAQPGQLAQIRGFSGGKLDKILGGIGQGIKIGGALGVPGLDKVQSGIEALGPGQSTDYSDELEQLGKNDTFLNNRINNVVKRNSLKE
jgi:hypothetical protein